MNPQAAPPPLRVAEAAPVPVLVLPDSVVVRQDTATLVTLAEAVPLPLATVQFWPAGCVPTVTA